MEVKFIFISHVTLKTFVVDAEPWKSDRTNAAIYPLNRELSNQPSNRLTNKVANDTIKENADRENNRTVNQETDGPTNQTVVR